jgi:hypothetical protein
MARSDADPFQSEKLERQRRLRNARSQRSYRRTTNCERVGKYLITEELTNFLVWDGLAPDTPNTAAVDQGVAHIIRQYLESRRKHYF